MIDNLIDDLNEVEAKAWVTALALTEAIKRLDEGNKAFRARTQQRLAKGEASGSVDVKQLRQITDAALNAVLRRMDSLDDLFPSAEVTALIKAYNALVDGKQFLLAKRKATNEAATVRKKDDWGKMLAEHYALFEVERKLSPGSLSFTGNTMGSKEQRLYELAVADSEKTIWVRLKRKKLVEATADEVAKAYVITYHTWDASKDENQEYAAVRAAIYETGDFSRTQALDPESAQASKEFLPLKTDGARTTATVERVTTEGADTNPQRPNGTWQRNIFYAREYPDGRFNTQRGVGWITLTRGEGGSWFVSDAKWTTV